MLEMEQPFMINHAKPRAWVRAIVTAINLEGAPRPTFARASQNVAAVATLLDTLPAPSTNSADKVYHQLKDILGVATMPQAEMLLQWWFEISISSPDCSKAS
jgi:hypothetical protein